MNSVHLKLFFINAVVLFTLTDVFAEFTCEDLFPSASWDQKKDSLPRNFNIKSNGNGYTAMSEFTFTIGQTIYLQYVPKLYGPEDIQRVRKLAQHTIDAFAGVHRLIGSSPLIKTPAKISFHYDNFGGLNYAEPLRSRIILVTASHYLTAENADSARFVAAHELGHLIEYESLMPLLPEEIVVLIKELYARPYFSSSKYPQFEFHRASLSELFADVIAHLEMGDLVRSSQAIMTDMESMHIEPEYRKHEVYLKGYSITQPYAKARSVVSEAILTDEEIDQHNRSGHLTYSEFRRWLAKNRMANATPEQKVRIVESLLKTIQIITVNHYQTMVETQSQSAIPNLSYPVLTGKDLKKLNQRIKTTFLNVEGQF